MTTYDAIVVGARCAGAATAMLLARAGADVLLVDRARFPSDIPHGHFIHRHGSARLARWGLLDDVLGTGCPPLTAFVQDLRDFPLHGTGLEVDGVPFGLGPRRSALDAVLVEAAVAAGAELRAGEPVLGYTAEDDRITGIRTRQGQEHADIVIGADGRNFPTTADLLAVFVGWPAGELRAVRADVERRFMAAVDTVPALPERVRAGVRAERFAGATQLPNFLRRPHGPGWALVGDAGCHKDPLLALGICDALRDAELLADALVAGDDLAEYERRRDEATMPDYQRNLAAATLQPPPPEVRAMRAAVRGDAAATRAFFLAQAGLGAPASRSTIAA